MKNLTNTISGSSVVVAIKEQVSSELSGEVVILNLKSGSYYSLNAVGAHIWSLIQEPKKVDHIQTILLDEYEIDAETCNRDLTTLLNDLASSGLVEVGNAATA